MAAFVRLAFTPATIKLYSSSEINLKLPLTHMTQFPLWFALTFTQTALIFLSKIRVWPDQLHSIPLPLPHLLIVLMSQGAQVGGRRDKQQQHVNNAKGGCSSPLTRSQKEALESLGLITYNDELLCVDINKASQLAGLM